MTHAEYVTTTHERVSLTECFADVGLAAVARSALGTVRHVQLPDIGTKVEAGDHLGVVEGTQTAAEFYAPCAGRVVAVADASASTSDWLVRLER
ncbi:MAG: hypothetical protein AAFU69_07935 [Pseudomonadota bacterium]